MYSAMMQSKVLKLRRKYQMNDDKANDEMLSRILWYSMPIVYTDFMNDSRKALNNIQAVKRRRNRYRNYVRDMVTTFDGKGIYLVSLTFSDDYYNSNSRDTRNQYARRYLNSVCLDYFACLDIGKENGREHYHAIVATDKPLSVVSNGKRKREFFAFANSEDAWRYGFYSIRPLATEDKDIYKTMNYALKSSDYAFKSADEENGIKPFHKRGVEHWHEVRDLAYERLPF